MTNINYEGFTFNDIMEMDAIISDIFKQHKLGVNINLKNDCITIKNLNTNYNKLSELDKACVRSYFEILYGTKTKIKVMN